MARHSATRHDRNGSNGLAFVATAGFAVLAVLVIVGVVFAVRSIGGAKPKATPTNARGAASPKHKAAGTSTPAAPKKPAATEPVSQPATDQAVPVLMYHHIMPNPNNFIAISPGEFEAQLKWLHDRGWHAVTMGQFIDFVQTGRRLPDKPFLITFDDGRSNQLTYGVPILKKYGYTATFFVCKKWVESPSASFMHADDLGKLIADGYDVQSHTNAHVSLVRSKSEDYALMKKRLWGETNGMRTWLDRAARTQVTALAYPGGAHDKLSPQLVREAGYAVAFTTETGLVRYKGQDPELLPRYNAGARGLRMSSFIAIFDKALAASTPKAAKPATSTATTVTP